MGSESEAIGLSPLTYYLQWDHACTYRIIRGRASSASEGFCVFCACAHSTYIAEIPELLHMYIDLYKGK